jgi:hypothetical protein
VTPVGRYSDARSLRAALEARLKRYAVEEGVPLDRLRKEAAYQRLLARLVEVAPPVTWALKGGLAMIARVGRDARATRDADTCGVRATRSPPHWKQSSISISRITSCSRSASPGRSQLRA